MKTTFWIASIFPQTKIILYHPVPRANFDLRSCSAPDGPPGAIRRCPASSKRTTSPSFGR
ncbi:hypothetical protein CEXT_676101, partial [Caerostris extrusa]